MSLGHLIVGFSLYNSGNVCTTVSFLHLNDAIVTSNDNGGWVRPPFLGTWAGSNDLSQQEVELSGNNRCQQIEINSYPDSPLFI